MVDAAGRVKLSVRPLTCSTEGRSAVRLHDPTRDGEAEARPPGFPLRIFQKRSKMCGRCSGAIPTPLSATRSGPWALVGASSPAPAMHPALRRELGRVAQQVAEHLEDPVPVGEHDHILPTSTASRIDFSSIAVLECRTASSTRAPAPGRRLHREVTRLDAGDVQEILPQAVHLRDQILDRFDPHRELRLQVPRRAREHPPEHHRVDLHRAQRVARGRAKRRGAPRRAPRRRLRAPRASRSRASSCCRSRSSRLRSTA
jgi:hypothetical protein